MLALNNFVLDLAALLALKLLLHRDAGAWRIFLGAVCGTLADCVAFWLCGRDVWYLPVVHFIVNPAVIFLCFRQAGWREFLRDYGLSYFVVLFLGGTFDWLCGGGVGIPYRYAAVPAFALLAAAVIWGRGWLKRRSRYLDVWVTQNGRTVHFLALADSGNLLRDPYVHKAVSVIDRVRYAEAFGTPGRVRLIPYETLGCADGLMEVVTVSGIKIWHGNTGRSVKNAALGLADHAAFGGKEYQMILNPHELLEDAGSKKGN